MTTVLTSGSFTTRKSIVVLAVALGMLIGSNVRAGDRGTAEEARALLQKAVEHYKQVGRTKALEDFTGKKAPWVDRDLYVACSNSKHILVANGAFPSYVGTSLDTVKDLNGTPLGESLWKEAEKGGVQSVEWHWFNPVTGKMELKTTLVQRLDADTQCSVGYYKPE